jgi:hypothetical protein
MSDHNHDHDHDHNHTHHHVAEDIELLTTATAGVYAGDHLLKATDPDENAQAHLVKAGIAAIVAIGAFELLRRAEAQSKLSNPSKSHENLYSSSHHLRSRSVSPSDGVYDRERDTTLTIRRSGSTDVKHHKAHFAEEVIGAYALGKELLGDKKHHVGHLVAEAIGAAGLFQELRARDKIEEDERKNGREWERETERSIERSRNSRKR